MAQSKGGRRKSSEVLKAAAERAQAHGLRLTQTVRERHAMRHEAEVGRAAHVAVIGGGAWGTALAKVLAECSHRVSLWCHRAEVASDINGDHVNHKHLPNIKLPQSLRADTDLAACTQSADLILLTLPSLYLQTLATQLKELQIIQEGKALIAIATKGFVAGSRRPRLSLEALEDCLPGSYAGRSVYLSGPSHAREVSMGKITGLIAASKSARSAIKLRSFFRGSALYIFPSFDVIGVQVCAAAKNVIAIGFGMLNALTSQGGSRAARQFGNNTESLLLAAGLNEMCVLGKAMDATHFETFTSIAGIGDLDVTCRSNQGRNRRFGRDIVLHNVLAPFHNLEDLLTRIGDLPYHPEGAAAALHIENLSQLRHLDLPLMQGVYRILNKEIDPRAFLLEYLSGISGRRMEGRSRRSFRDRLQRHKDEKNYQ